LIISKINFADTKTHIFLRGTIRDGLTYAQRSMASDIQ